MGKMLKLWFLCFPLLVYVVSCKREEVAKEWWEKAIFYQIYPRSFKDSDGDGIGDLNGITGKLAHLKNTGVGAVVLSPIFKSPMHDSGYDVSDYYAIHEEYGTMKDFERLILKSNELDIKIILELVPNHCSNESEWFQKSLAGEEFYRNWFVWADPYIDDSGHRTPPNNWRTVNGNSAWEYMNERDQYYLHQFTISQPDLQFHNMAVLTEIKNILQFWLNKGVFGFRMDAVDHIFEIDAAVYDGYPSEPPSGRSCQEPDSYDYLEHIYTRNREGNYDLVQQWREVLEDFRKRDGVTRVLMTEAYTDIKRSVRFYQEGYRESAHVPLNFGLVADFHADSDARDLKLITDRWLTYKPMEKPANWIIGSHDVKRVATRFRSHLVDAMNMLVLLLPGIAITYQGEEIGMVDGSVSWEETRDPLALTTSDHHRYTSVSRDPARTPFQWSSKLGAGFSTSNKTWLPVAPGYETLNLADQRSSATGRSHYHTYRSLALLRRRPEFRHGDYESLALGTDVFAFKRQYKDSIYLVVLNIGRNSHLINLAVFSGVEGRLSVEISSVLSSRASGDHVNADSFELAADEALVLHG